ncbi:MAG: hypothetical protein JRH20_07585 [Deltaproteobacteria bacterium]|nr:hypothetical protein [Deltaproteobacteria bacterium]
MPLLRLVTNQPVAEERRDILMKRLSKSVANVLGKPESYVMITLEEKTPMLFAGSSEPTGFFEVTSLGSISAEQAQRFSAEISGILAQELNLPANRVYSKYVGWTDRQLWGFKGGTF